MNDGKIKAVIFDLDGTLIDTLDDLTDAVNVALGKLSKRKIDRETTRRFVGNGVGKLMNRALWHTEGKSSEDIHPDYNKALADFTAYYDKHSADKTRLYDGVKEMLDGVHSLGIKTAVVTNKYDGAAQALKAKLFPEVNFLVGLTEGIRPKPARDGVDTALSLLGAERGGVVYVGDGEVDVETAKNADLPMIAVTWGFRDRALLESLKPDKVIDKPCELISIIKALAV
ncbi:MAG: HAD-IA family hydrolase [Clostridiales bacterium]|nr:HAD-IA family hydrolase [Clostridiales bacterium]